MKRKIFFLSLIVVCFDQVSKLMVVKFIKLNESVKVITDFFYLTYLRNEGAAWDLFDGNGYFLGLLSVLVLVVIFKYLLGGSRVGMRVFEQVGYVLLCGGISGNLVDRLLYGYVVDWLDFYPFNYNYPVFNLADIAIVSGVGLIMMGVYKDESNRDKC